MYLLFVNIPELNIIDKLCLWSLQVEIIVNENK